MKATSTLRLPGHGGMRRYLPGFFLFLVVLSLVYVVAFLQAFSNSDASPVDDAANVGVGNLRQRRRAARRFPLHRLTGVRKIPRRIKLGAALGSSSGVEAGASAGGESAGGRVRKGEAGQTAQQKRESKCNECGCFKIEYNVDVQGSDLTSAKVGTLQECCNMCSDMLACMGFVFSVDRCWMKKEGGGKHVTKSGVVYGSKLANSFQGNSEVAPPPPPPPAAVASTATTKVSKKAKTAYSIKGHGELVASGEVDSFTLTDPDIIEAKSVAEGKDKPAVQGVIIYTVHKGDGKRMAKLINSLRLLELNFLACFSYPVHIFFESPVDEAMVRKIAASVPSAYSVTVQRICFADCTPVTAMDVSKAKASLKKLKYGWLGYANMCRFYSYTWALLPSMQKYDYYLRMDDDLYLIDPIMADPFATMAASGCEYGYGHVTEDIKQVTEGLYDTVKFWMKMNKDALGPAAMARVPYFQEGWKRDVEAAKKGGVEWTKGQGAEYSRRMYETNFEISSFAHWRSKAWTSLMKHVDKSGGFYTGRWGDAPIHGIGIPLLLPSSRACRIGIKAFHQVHKWYDPKNDIHRAEALKKNGGSCANLMDPTSVALKALIEVPAEHRFGPDGSHGEGKDGREDASFIP